MEVTKHTDASEDQKKTKEEEQLQKDFDRLTALLRDGEKFKMEEILFTPFDVNGLRFLVLKKKFLLFFFRNSLIN